MTKYILFGATLMLAACGAQTGPPATGINSSAPNAASAGSNLTGAGSDSPAQSGPGTGAGGSGPGSAGAPTH